MNRFSLRVVRGAAWPEGVFRPSDHPDTAGSAGTDDRSAGGERQLVVVVDGVAELFRWEGMGLDPDDVLNPDFPWLPPADGTALSRVVQRCRCGIIGCGSLTMTIGRSGDAVVWSQARDGDRRYDIGPFSFHAEAYEAELRRAHRERPWERHEETVARLVTEALRPLRQARPRSFDWASAEWGPGRVVVSMTDWRPNPKAGKARRAYSGKGGGSWRSIEPDELAEQHLGVFPIPPGLSPEEAAEANIVEVRTRDPRVWTPPAPGH
jgi:hypothetical protein